MSGGHYLLGNLTESEGIEQAVAIARKAIDSFRMIPIEKRQPTGNGSYLVQIENTDGTATLTYMTVDHHNEDGTWLHFPEGHAKVVAWMPLPKPYQGGE